MNNKINGSSKNRLSKGYAINKINSSSNRMNKTKKEYDVRQYPNGFIPFFFLLLFYLIFTIVVLSIGFTDEKISSFYPWYWSTLSASVSYLLMNVLWWIGRTGNLPTGGYIFMKCSRAMKLNKIRDKIDFTLHEPAINDVNSNSEFKEYCSIRKNYTKKFFVISITTSFCIFLINMIISFSVAYTIYA